MLERTKAPSFSQDFAFQLPQPEIISLSNGSRIFWLNEIQQDVFKIELIFNAAKWNEPAKGISHFLALLLDKGTYNHTSQQISNLLDFHGAQLEIHPGYDYTSVSLYGLNKSLHAIFPVLIDLITNSTFPAEELKLQKDIFIQNLRVNNKKTSFLASKLLRLNLFGKDHPYGSSLEEAHAATIQPDNLISFFKSSFLLRDIFLVGSFKTEDIRWVVTQIENISAEKERANNSYEILQGKDVKTKELEGVQATLRLGKRFLNRNDVDYPSSLIANHILGGFFGSRLMKNIREEKGLTYGIYSSIQPLNKDCFLTIGADVNVDKVDIALTEIKNEIERLIHQTISEEELLIAKNHFLGSLQLEVSNPFSAIEKIKTITLNQLDIKFYENLFASIKNFSPEELKATTEKHFLPSSLTTIVVS
jgi:predicted Zn-dependent peptidase